LSVVSAQRNASIVRDFLSARFANGRIDLVELTASDLTAFILRESRRYSIGTTKYVVTALRSFLRYLHLKGEIAQDLSGAVPAIAGWRLSGLPKGLECAEVQKVLGTCDRRTHVGRRDYAVLLLMVRLGLRRGEVAALELDDINWVGGELIVRGKGRRED